MKISKKKLRTVCVILFLALASYFVTAQTTTSFSGTTPTSTYVTTQPRAGFQSYYGGNVNTYWPVLGDSATCEARQDVLLNVAPVGCQPVVVRSDLLAEQNVPVFCQIDALEINPLVDVSQVRNIRFTGQYPEEVSGTGFHPARAALRTNNNLLGSPTPNNIGYVVVILKKQPDESKLPDSVNLTLSADIDYVSGNAYGIGKSEFILETQSDAEWQNEKAKQSFWNGRYYVRLENADANVADVSIYEGERKVTTQRVEKGKTSSVVYAPGLYCRAGLQIAYDGFVTAKNKARIEVSSGNQVDTFDVYEGSRFLDDRCSVRSINIYNDSGVGTVTGSCNGKSFSLELKNRIEGAAQTITLGNAQYVVTETSLNEFEVTINQQRYTLDTETKLLAWINGKATTQITADGTINETITENEKRTELTQIRNTLIQYKTDYLANPTLTSKDLSQGTVSYYNNAIDAYEEIADSYSGEKEGQIGQDALTRAIKLAQDTGKTNDQRRLIEKITNIYPNAPNNAYLLQELNRISQFDSSSAGESIQFDDKARTIRLVSLSEPKNKALAELVIENTRLNIAQGETKTFDHGGSPQGRITIDQINPEQVELSAYCATTDTNNNTIYSTSRQRFALSETGPATEICGVAVRLANANAQSIAKVRILPQAQGTRSQANFTVQIGIEKRAIELNPDKTQERIDRLNETVMKWEEISEQLGNVVTGLKTACFATSTLLTFKNFASGLSGETLARQEVMGGDNGWRAWCQARSGGGMQYNDLDACYTANAAKIDSDVATTTNAIASVNQKIQTIQNNHVTSQDTFGSSVNTEAVRTELAQRILAENQGATINMGNGFWTEGEQQIKDVPLTTILSEDNVKNGLITTDEMRSIMLNLELQKAGGLNSEINTNPNEKLITNVGRINQNVIMHKEFEAAKDLQVRGYPQLAYVGSASQQKRAFDVVRLNNQLRAETGFTDESITHIAMVGANPGSAQFEGENAIKYKQGTYFLGLTGDPNKGVYNVKSVSQQGNTTNLLQGEDAVGFANAYGIGTIEELDRLSYTNKIDPTSAQCKFYETEPYRGMPAVIPFDTQNGWYAATKQTLPTFGGIGAFDSSGRVTSFWLCNVGSNGRVEFETGLGDDLCQQVNLNTGQPIGSFPGLSEQEARTKVNQGVQAIQQAANQFGNKIITVNGQRCEVGAPSTGQPGTQCQDFMSPSDCHLMFNVCDPVVCPTSRCDFGGQYAVSNVAQSGIIGSTLLCLPNIQEGIAIPVCLTGIQAGIDGLTSIMRNHRDCLVESLETGQTVGICDQIYSVYMCEFFWNQVAPLVNVLVPKIFEIAYGQGVRGGAEYLTVQSAWQNTQNSFNYFTQSYAANSIAAFQVRSVEEAGTQFCQGFISAKAPTAFKTLVEPDSPPQFHAYFDEKTFSDVTIPATSQYKVFYHIFAGKDQGVNYNVYLRSPPESSYYQNAPYIQVASGFIPRGEYASQTRDFTAPQGYKELCVRINNEEKCGFTQVSTSFAVNYLRDSYVENQLTNTNIQSEAECIGGTPNLGAVALNPNLQQGVEEVINPEIYNRGVVRICGTQNPGLSTDPSRFVQVGTCGDEKVACWLDKQSVDNAITDGNLLTRNATLTDLEAQTNAYLTNNGEVLTPDQASAEIESLQRAYQSLEGKSGDKVAEANEIKNRIDAVFSRLFYGIYKAEALFVKGKTNELVTRDYLVKDEERIRQTRTDTIQTGSGSAIGSDSGNAEINDAIPGSELAGYGFLSSSRGTEITYNGELTDIYLANIALGGVFAYDLKTGDTITTASLDNGRGGRYIVVAGIDSTSGPNIISADGLRFQGLPENIREHLERLNGRLLAPGFPLPANPQASAPRPIEGTQGYDFIKRGYASRNPSQLRFQGSQLPIFVEGNVIYYVTNEGFFITPTIDGDTGVQATYVGEITNDGRIVISTGLSVPEQIQTHLSIINGKTYPAITSQAQTGSPNNADSSGSGSYQVSDSCTVSNLRWEWEIGLERNNADVGDTVYLAMDSSGCAGERVTIRIVEVEEYIGLFEIEGEVVEQIAHPLEDGTTYKEYTIPNVNDAGNNFELRFTIEDAESNKLTVSEQSESEAIIEEGPESKYFVIDSGEVIFEGSPTGITIDRNNRIISATFWDNGEQKTFRAGTVGRIGRINIIDENLITCIDEDIECAAMNSRVIFGIEDIRNKFLQDDGQIVDIDELL